MNTLIVITLLPILFILHNVEEYTACKGSRYSPLKIVNDPVIFKYAITMLSVIVSFISVASYFFANHIMHLLSLIIFLSLFINAIQHVITSLILRKVVAGTSTAFFLIIPFSAYVLMKDDGAIFFEIFANAFYWLACSLLTMSVFIFVSLYCGYILKKYVTDKANNTLKQVEH